MTRPLDPPRIAAPAASYAHAVETAAGARMVHTSGILPIAPDGQVPADDGAQAAVVWDNIEAILAEADMGVEHIVSMTTYAVPGVDLAAVMAERDRRLGGHLGASILVTVHSLAQAAWRVEIAVVAAA